MHLGFRRQLRLSGACARHTIRHGLLCLGVSPSEEELTRAIGGSRLVAEIQGIDEFRIKSALTALSLPAQEIYVDSSSLMRRQLDTQLQGGAPIIVCLDHWEHWALLCGRQGDDYVLVDSDDKRVVVTIRWVDLKKRLRAKGEVKPYYGLAIVPAKRRRPISMVPRISLVLEDLAHKERRLNWGKLALLLARCFKGGSISSIGFFGHYRRGLYRGLQDTAARNKLAWLERAAKAYGLTLGRSDLEDARAKIARGVAEI